MEKVNKIRKMLQAQLQSELSVKEFCYSEGIGYSTYYARKKWLNNYEQKPQFAQIFLKRGEELSSANRVNDDFRQTENFQINRKENTSNEVHLLELKYPNGMELRLSGILTPEILKSLVNP